MKISETKKIIEFLKRKNLIYEKQKHNKILEEKGNFNNICITVKNPKSKDNLYINIEDSEENTVSYKNWHSHYFYTSSNFIIKDLKDIFENRKSIIIINSMKRWICCDLIDKNELNKEKKLKHCQKIYKKNLKK